MSKPKAQKASKQAANTSSLDSPVLAEHAEAIRMLRGRIVGDYAEIGRRLAEVKRIAGHGNWLPWLDREFEWSADTAERFIRVHKFIDGLSDSESVRNLVLPLSSVYLLAAPSTPQESRDKIIERAKTGEAVPAAEVKRVIAKGRRQPAKKKRTPDDFAREMKAKQPAASVPATTPAPDEATTGDQSADHSPVVVTDAGSVVPVTEDEPATEMPTDTDSTRYTVLIDAWHAATPADRHRFMHFIGARFIENEGEITKH
jgi:hypothetical protein